MALTSGDGRFVGVVAMDAIACAGERFGDDLELLVVQVILTVRDGGGTHVVSASEERGP